MINKTFLSNDQIDYFNKVLQELNKETNRASVILLVAEIESVLRAVLERFLLPEKGKTSSSLLNADGPLGSLASRIEIIYRLGLISSVLHKELHLIRKIRNCFAHTSLGISFDKAPINNLINNLYVPQWAIKGNPSNKELLSSKRDQFILSCAAVVLRLRYIANTVEMVKEHDIEFKTQVEGS